MGNQAGIIIRNVKNELFHSAKRLILNEVKGIECLPCLLTGRDEEGMKIAEQFAKESAISNQQSIIGLQFFIPRGFAHGFAVLTETAVFQYKCDEFYHPEADGGINIKDESLGIDWRIPMEKAILSEKDLKHACLKDAVLDFDINDKLYK